MIANDTVQNFVFLNQHNGTFKEMGASSGIAFDSYGNQDSSKMIFVEHIEGTNLVIDERHGCLLKDHCSF